MVIDHTRSLHEGVRDGRTHELEAALLQVLAYGVRLRRASRDLLERAPGVDERSAANELPEISVEAAEFVLHSQHGTGVLHGGIDLQAIANNAGVGEKLPHLALSIPRDCRSIKVVKGSPVVVPLLENSLPAQACLGAFQDEELEEPSVVMDRNAPLLVVVEDHKVTLGPTA